MNNEAFYTNHCTRLNSLASKSRSLNFLMDAIDCPGLLDVGPLK